ncbi:MAG TPA: ATP-binding protein [Myxococcota bacterium]|nr:ATP-binding protein [Myxococcota bacterium]
MAASDPIGRRYHLSRWQSVLFALAGLALLAAGAIAWREARSVGVAVSWAQRTFQVLLDSDALLAALTDAETSQRGYLLTRDPAQLARYEGALPRVQTSFESLRRATADDAEEQARIAELEPLLAERLHSMARTLERAHEAKPGALVASSTAGSEAMNAVRLAIDDIRARDHDLLRQRLAVRDQALRGTRRDAFVLGALSVGIFSALVFSINRTIGARAAAERSARESEQRLRVTLESIGDAVIATDVAGRVTYMNPVAEALTGWRRADARDLPLDQVFRVVNEFTREGIESPVAKVTREGGVVGVANHALLIARDGSERPIDDSGAPIRDAAGALMGVVLVFRDVTARRQSEQARERLLRSESEREIAQGASRAKDEFLAVVSHELRSPLTAALSWVELLRGESLDGAQRARALDTIERSLRQQAVLVSDLLDVSRIVAGKLTLEPVAADVATLVRDAVNDHRALAESAGVALRHEPRLPVIAMVDPARIRQIVNNLLANAIRHTPAGGAVEVEIAANEDRLDLWVRDTGRGIPAALLPHIFERFRQGNAAAVREHGGLGLGLAIAKHLVEAHGGSIDARSDGEGKGATFHARFPLQPPERRSALGAAAVETRRAGMRRLSGSTILLVEDHADTRDAIEMLLRSHGARVLVAGSVPDGLAWIESERPALVVSDLGLPQQSGLSLIERLREIDTLRGTRTPAIVASGFASPETRRAALAAGFDAYLTKPIELGTLLAQIVALLAR